MGLLDGGGAAIMHAVFGGIYLDASLYRPTTVPNGKGGGTIVPGEPQAVKVQQEAATEAMRSREGYTARDVRFLMLAHGVARPTTDHQIGFEGTLYAITPPVGRDPAGGYWDIHARPIGEDYES